VIDNTNPATPTLASLTDECSVTAVAPTTTDNCAGTITATTTDPTEYTEQGTYTITWNFADRNGNSIDVEQTVIVEDITNPTIECIENQIINLNEGETFYTVSGAEIDPTSTDDNCSVASVVNDFNSLSTLNNAQLPIGTTTIEWTVTDDAGNETICSFDVVVDTYVGIIDLSANEISVYPNPTSGIVNFDLSNLNVQRIIISDISGKVIIEKTVTNQHENFDFSDYISGIYLVKLMTDKDVFTTKIIKK